MYDIMETILAFNLMQAKATNMEIEDKVRTSYRATPHKYIGTSHELLELQCPSSPFV